MMARKGYIEFHITQGYRVFHKLKTMRQKTTQISSPTPSKELGGKKSVDNVEKL